MQLPHKTPSLLSMWLTQLLMWADIQIIKVVNGKQWEILLVPEEVGEGEGYCGYFILRTAELTELPDIFLR